MFKKFIRLSLILSAVFIIHKPSFALYWGVIEDYEEKYKEYAIQKLIYNTPIKYYLTIQNSQKSIPQKQINKEGNNLEEEFNTALTQEKLLKDFEATIQPAFDMWTNGVKSAIKQEGRAKDILPFLKNIKLIKTENKKEADIRITLSDEQGILKNCGKSIEGCYAEELNTIFILSSLFIQNPKKTKMVLVHEIGHFFGLADQYRDTRSASAVYSTFNRIGNKNSVMSSHSEESLGCDDVDGFINLIDLTLALNNKGQFSTRAKNPWASFCNGKKNGNGELFKDEFYREAKLLKKPPYLRGYCLYKYDENGDISQKTCQDPFNFIGKELTIEYDAFITGMKDPKTNMEFEYFYDFKQGVIFAFIKGKEYHDIPYIYKIYKTPSGYRWNNYYTEDNFEVIFIYKDNTSILMGLDPEVEKPKEYLTFIFDRKTNNFAGFIFTANSGSKKAKLQNLTPFDVEVFFEADICSFYFSGEKNPILKLPLSHKDKEPIIYGDFNKIKMIEQHYNISTDQLIKEVHNMCTMKIDEELIKVGQDKARYFKFLAEVYHKTLQYPK